MKKTEIAIFLTLNGKANEAIEFYQTLFNGDLLFKITNKEFKERMNPTIEIPKEEEEFISHSILIIGNLQLQIADNPVYPSMTFVEGTTMSFSVLTKNIGEAQTLYEDIVAYKDTAILQEPTTNEFADFYAIVKDPYGVIIQLTNEREADPSKKRNQ